VIVTAGTHSDGLRSALEAALADARRAHAELRASQARIVAVADAERRRIERDLHDGAQQQLIVLAIELRRARELIERDPVAAAAGLDRAGAAAGAAIEELGALARGIFPPVLRDSGLVAALRVAARRNHAPIDLRVDCFARPAPAVEAAVYFAVIEALQNATKHAPDARVRVHVGERRGRIVFEVADDGPGFDAASAERGNGMRNIADRVGALGGTVLWDAGRGRGTRVRGEVPYAAPCEGRDRRGLGAVA
jgi:signal transduction histidine kinase